MKDINEMKEIEVPRATAKRLAIYHRYLRFLHDTLKWVLSEVLKDLRKQGRCHIKYEKRQGCFHITVR